jgi:hypothetical protein
VGKREGKKPLRIPRHRWENYITIDLRQIRGGGIDWIHLTQGGDQCRALMNTLMNLRVP